MSLGGKASWEPKVGSKAGKPRLRNLESGKQSSEAKACNSEAGTRATGRASWEAKVGSKPGKPELRNFETGARATGKASWEAKVGSTAGKPSWEAEAS